ncbi:MAG: hypothetical protein ABJA77_04775 [Variovorax sp.]
MAPTIELLIAAYTRNYPQQVRDLTEALCASTTQLARPGVPRPQILGEDVRQSAAKHGIDPETLTAAIADYSDIEAQAAEMHRRGRF